LPVGTDVTETLGIKKWEIPEVATAGGDVSGLRPGWIEKSDETRVQSAPELLEAFRGLSYYITTKYDGSSHFIGIDDENVFHAGSHNMELKETDKPGTFWAWVKENNLPEKLQKIKNKNKFTRIYVLGEWCGEGIQKNRLKLTKPYWFPFTANADGRRLTFVEFFKLCQDIDIRPVELEEVGYDLPSKYPTVDALIERAGANISDAYNGEQEGIVIRPIESYYTPEIETPVGVKKGTPRILSMKVINNKYLLKKK
jgi:RNA ligase (TIGR02306 family)